MQPEKPIWFDDGKIGGVIEQIEARHVQIRITQMRLGGSHLWADKRINLLESHLPLGALPPRICRIWPLLPNLLILLNYRF